MAPVLTSPLVSTQWLADHLGADGLLVLDASVHTDGIGLGMSWHSARDAHERHGHVPGAVYADLIDEFSSPETGLPFTRPGVDRFEAAARALGVSRASTVVVYDDGIGEWSARLWWIFRSFGFRTVAVLDGGFAKWRDEGRPVRVGALSRAPRRVGDDDAFVAGEELPLWADRSRVLRAVDGSEPAALVLAADPADLGDDHPPLVPGTTTIRVRDLLGESNAFLRRSELERALAPVLTADEVVTYCGVGSASCVDALALTVLGHEKVRVYDGSLAEWWREPIAS
ncbi:sulfurtransferase [Curtobacterium sp. MCBD17_021]|uniref:sulfurtransferase n=1 Tax=Curtobacterium sp. MCBD17_021 TaxID=2175665 RepID=UPI0011B56A0C|nr:rhodanese-like domain-containing protein [Curtobacterium sp. MCBD17_021]